MNDLDDLNAQIESIKIEIQKTKEIAASAPAEIARIDLQIPITDRKILDLQQQLANAQREKADLLNEKERFRNVISDANSKINRL